MLKKQCKHRNNGVKENVEKCNMARWEEVTSTTDESREL